MNNNILEMIKNPEKYIKDNKEFHDFMIQLETESYFLYDALSFDDRKTINSKYGVVTIWPFLQFNESNLLFYNTLFPDFIKAGKNSVKVMFERYQEMLKLYLLAKKEGKTTKNYEPSTEQRRHINLLQSVIPYPIPVNSFVMGAPGKVPMIVNITDSKTENKVPGIFKQVKDKLSSELGIDTPVLPTTAPSLPSFLKTPEGEKKDVTKTDSEAGLTHLSPLSTISPVFFPSPGPSRGNPPVIPLVPTKYNKKYFFLDSDN